MILYKETRNLESVDLFYGIGEWKSSQQVVVIHITKGKCAEDCALQNFMAAKFKD